MVQQLGLCTLTAKGLDSIPGWGTKILQAAWRGQKIMIIITTIMIIITTTEKKTEHSIWKG